MALSQVHFKFKSQVDYDSVAFDGPVVTVGELKALIAERTGMGPASASELVLSDPRTGEEYRGGSALVPNAASVLVRRAPQAVGGGPGGVGNARARRGKGRAVTSVGGAKKAQRTYTNAHKHTHTHTQSPHLWQVLEQAPEQGDEPLLVRLLGHHQPG